ncbi:hypothetical protein V1517DRAFT_314600 [Lipomyces orientalis]|uniref:Uncharacterized protein n=1 Tax=Lipomyces orientalis TaxID=1233043 RepID=A0ACC3TVY0_9ASCO
MLLRRGDITYEMLLSKRDDNNDPIDKTISFAKSFRSWDTCMDNLGCKIIAIVGIVLAVILVFTIITWIIRIIWCGAEAGCWLCGKCCSCCSSDSGRRGKPSVNVYNIPQQQPYYMGPPAPPQQQGLPPMPTYGNVRKSYQPLKDDEIEMGRVSNNKYRQY